MEKIRRRKKNRGAAARGQFRAAIARLALHGCLVGENKASLIITITFFSESSTVSFYLTKKFQFLSEVSVPENTEVIVPNIPLFAAAASMKNADSWFDSQELVVSI